MRGARRFRLARDQTPRCEHHQPGEVRRRQALVEQPLAGRVPPLLPRFDSPPISGEPESFPGPKISRAQKFPGPENFPGQFRSSRQRTRSNAELGKVCRLARPGRRVETPDGRAPPDRRAPPDQRAPPDDQPRIPACSHELLVRPPGLVPTRPRGPTRRAPLPPRPAFCRSALAPCRGSRRCRPCHGRRNRT